MSSIIKCQAIAFLFCRCQYPRNLFHSGHAGSQFLQPFDFSTAKANNLNAAARQELNRLPCNCRQQMPSWGLRFCLWSYFFVPLCLQYESMLFFCSTLTPLKRDETHPTKAFRKVFFFVSRLSVTLERPPGPRQDCMSLYSPNLGAIYCTLQ